MSPARPLSGGKPLSSSRSYGNMLAADTMELDARLLQEERRASAAGNGGDRASLGGGTDEQQPMGPFMFPPSAAGHFAEVCPEASIKCKHVQLISKCWMSSAPRSFKGFTGALESADHRKGCWGCVD